MSTAASGKDYRHHALDHVCYLLDESRSCFIRRAVKRAIADELARDPDFWERIYYACRKDSKQKKIF
ncbi:MAG: hypothetical protein L7F78_17410 [Syntrophales bacterium LBB04]|nr:hypothetical protein [Syntrophales bacterium LBB04]